MSQHLRPSSSHRGRRSAVVTQLLTITPAEQQVLESIARSTTGASGTHRRARALLLLQSGLSVTGAALRVGVGRRYLYQWLRAWSVHRTQWLTQSRNGRRTPVASD